SGKVRPHSTTSHPLNSTADGGHSGTGAAGHEASESSGSGSTAASGSTATVVAAAKPGAFHESQHSAPASGSGTSQQLVNSLTASETVAPSPNNEGQNGAPIYADAETPADTNAGSATGHSGINFHVTLTATAIAAHPSTDATVNLTASTQSEGSSASYVFTATLSNASE